jgi:uncharacterized phage protein (predicted DNA packaging)
MKWLTLDYIKEHSRIKYSDEDKLLELYGSIAEKMVLNVIGRTYEDMVEEYGEMPEELMEAALMLVDVSYMQRSPVSQTNLYVVPYTFDFLVKPYMRLVH